MKRLLTLISLWLVTACTHREPAPSIEAADPKSIVNDIKHAMTLQEEAWNRYDLEGFMQAYWKSDSLIFIGKRGITYGWATTLSNYQKTYSHPEAMGKLVFENLKIEPLEDHHALVAGRWNLYRTEDTLSGSYLLVWQQIKGEWKIIADHSS